MVLLRFTFLLALFAFASNLNAQEIQSFQERPVFENGSDGYACFRIPAIIKDGKGNLLAFCEARANGCSDFGNVDIVMKKSTDHGQSWGPLQIVVNNGDYQAGNPAPVLDMYNDEFPEGKILLLFNTGNNHEAEVRKGNGTREIWQIESVDQGEHWTNIKNISDQVHPFRKPEEAEKAGQNHWRSYANTPGHAIQLQKGEFQGRIYVPANHSEGNPLVGFNEYRAHGFFSDNHGISWKLSNSVAVESSNESIAVEIGDGILMQNIREQSGLHKSRLIALSSDGGASWDTTYFDSNLIDPVCQASILGFKLPNKKEALLFSNPASTSERKMMTVRLSMDNGKTWPVSRIVNEGESAYSDLVFMTNQEIGLLYERGNNGGIHFSNFNLSWLLKGDFRLIERE